MLGFKVISILSIIEICKQSALNRYIKKKLIILQILNVDF